MPAAPAVDSADNWVQCDRCGKWRRVGKGVVDSLADVSAHWFCEDNPDPFHNSCTTAQELTNEEIDQGREGESLLERERTKRRRRPAVWQLIRCAVEQNTGPQIRIACTPQHTTLFHHLHAVLARREGP